LGIGPAARSNVIGVTERHSLGGPAAYVTGDNSGGQYGLAAIRSPNRSANGKRINPSVVSVRSSACDFATATRRNRLAAT